MSIQIFKSILKPLHMSVWVLMLILLSSLLFNQTVHAEPQVKDNIDVLQDYCKRYLKDKEFKGDIDAACSEKKMTRARNAASNSIDFSTNKAEDGAGLIVAQAEGFIRQAMKEKPKTANEFNKELDKIYDERHLDASNPNPASGINSNSIGSDNSFSDPNAGCEEDNCDFVKKYINPFIGLMSVTFGLIAIISLIMGGIQYTSSQGDPQKVTKAKHRIGNTILALVSYIFLYAFLQFLVPGGLFNR